MFVSLVSFISFISFVLQSNSLFSLKKTPADAAVISACPGSSSAI